MSKTQPKLKLSQFWTFLTVHSFSYFSRNHWIKVYFAWKPLTWSWFIVGRVFTAQKDVGCIINVIHDRSLLFANLSTNELLFPTVQPYDKWEFFIHSPQERYQNIHCLPGEKHQYLSQGCDTSWLETFLCENRRKILRNIAKTNWKYNWDKTDNKMKTGVNDWRM